MQNPQELIFHLSSNHQERLTTVQEAQICIQNNIYIYMLIELHIFSNFDVNFPK